MMMTPAMFTMERTRATTGHPSTAHVLLLVFSCLPLTSSVTCNAYDTCFLPEKRLEMQEAVYAQDKEKVCRLVASAIECLDKAEDDCNNSENVPVIIKTGIEHRRANISSYCVSEASCAGRLAVSRTVITGWTMLLMVSTSSSVLSTLAKELTLSFLHHLAKTS
ncbi:uncharacterized protein LOC112560732 [Pomacea canaliculata]|uniref:uncharacterized protein LOC112560732 n=1 Tax=Pomacea canaliculata TaxID=400727 RepID=UPI000D73931C|nr:uncharacterized protein LOC112560732 [Pomacea canaliculata]